MREFLRGLDLDKDTIDTIMAEHGKLITEAKEKATKYEEEMKTIKAENEKYKSNEVDSSKLAKENKELKAQLQMSDSGVKKEFKKFVVNEIMERAGDDKDFESVLTDYKKENPQYFGNNVKKVQTSSSLGGNEPKPTSTNDIMNDLLRGTSTSSTEI